MADLSFDDLIPARQAAPAPSASPPQPAASDINFDDLVPAKPTGPTEQEEAAQNARALGIELQQPQAAPQQSGGYSGAVVPLKRTEDGRIRPAVPGVVQGAIDSLSAAVTAPGRAMAGDLQVTGQDGSVTPEAIAEGANFAMWASPASPASKLAPKPVQQAAPPAKPEGLAVAEAGQRLGVDLPRAVTSDNMIVQQAGKNLSNVPIGGTPLRKASQTAIDQLDDAAMRVQQGYGSGNPAIAGSAAREGITDYAKNTLSKLVTERYDAVDNLVTPNVTTPLESTARAADRINAVRQNSKIPGSSKAVELVDDALKTEGGLNYEGIKGLRTYVGDLLEDPARIAQTGVPEKELRAIYSGLSDDLRSAVQRAGGDEALTKWESANTFAAKVAKDRENLQKVFGRNASDEGIFSKIVDMAGNTSKADRANLLRVKKAVSPETWNEISSAVVARMGRDGNGNFSPDRFLTAYGKVSEQGKKALFQGAGKENLAQSLDDIATVSQRFKQLNQFANPSGTAQTVMGGSIIPALYVAPMTTVSSVAGSRALSSMLAKPDSAAKLAAWAKAYERAATNPAPMTDTILRSRSRILAVELAREAGDSSLVQQFIPRISQVGKVPADQGGEQNGMEEGQNGGVAGEADQLLQAGGW